MRKKRRENFYLNISVGFNQGYYLLVPTLFFQEIEFNEPRTNIRFLMFEGAAFTNKNQANALELATIFRGILTSISHQVISSYQKKKTKKFDKYSDYGKIHLKYFLLNFQILDFVKGKIPKLTLVENSIGVWNSTTFF